jgi:hypothetical protein
MRKNHTEGRKLKSDVELRLESKIAQQEQLIRKLLITLANTGKLLESVLEHVPNPIEWSNMLDYLYRDIDASGKVLKNRRCFPPKE